ncbi:MAG: hypothetical protein A2Z09_01125 [Nitrospirae bacterium RBG_16_43_8]|nr:MAG: hypothetical protein A2Z09_01125 [Nitrospirae bacterium RBG_16_43_8]
MMHLGYYGCGFGFGWFFMIAFWILVILGIVYLFRLTTCCRKPGVQETALDILKRRYTKGEVSKEEFEEKKKDIV